MALRFVIEAPKIHEYNYVVYCEMKMCMPVSYVLLHRRQKKNELKHESGIVAANRDTLEKLFA